MFKPRNILIGKKEALKFCDLGIVADCAIEKGREVPDWRTIGHGNLKYMAPEQVKTQYIRKIIVVISTDLLAHQRWMCLRLD